MPDIGPINGLRGSRSTCTFRAFGVLYIQVSTEQNILETNMYMRTNKRHLNLLKSCYSHHKILTRLQMR